MTSTIWLTGLPGSGKTTLARSLAADLEDRGHDYVLLDGEEERYGYSTSAHRINTHRLAEAAARANRAGSFAIVAAVSPASLDRARARTTLGARKMLEIYLSTPLGVCERRDTKGNYLRARMGELPGFTGIDASYQVPRQPHLVLDTFILSVRDCELRIMKLLAARKKAVRTPELMRMQFSFQHSVIRHEMA